MRGIDFIAAYYYTVFRESGFENKRPAKTKKDNPVL
jgi:hypothetical protein